MPTLLITGANRGIGLELTRQYAADGWDVIACARQPDKADELKALGSRVTVEALDVTDYAAVDRLAETYKDRPIDLLINNAGIYGIRNPPLTIADFDDYLKVLQVNAVAPMKVTLAMLPALKKAKAAKIATISSRMGSIGSDGSGAYVYRASKAAINAAMHSLALDLRPTGITCILLHPGWVKTDMGGQGADITPQVSASGIRSVIARATAADTGRFFNYDGAEIPW
ncbi:MAG TPA: SDR family oxidoreductase [Ferrovibrio sp.]|uniref:SDR family oxidoreductase n=1 Tax=Ferrovibrio sp. TaxID=1917215 RepID=UPI002B4AFBA0|nr:SDR family oxidoreductase [Ferrovibrio sp.]HLT78612.1 SDR family oxidoreductase [Ferrovibrio sp.]